jgi:hypothetical protein
MKKIQDYLEIFQKPFNFGLLVAAYLLVAAVILPNVIQSIEELAGHSIEILDLQIFGYSPQRAFDILDNQGKEGREVYQVAELSADIVYPFIYSILFSSILFFFVKKANLIEKPYEKVIFLPFLTLILDWVENAFIVSILMNYDTRPTILVQIAGVFTVLKWLSLGLVLLSFLGLLGVTLRKMKRYKV